MEEFYALLERFQALKKIGCSKSSSFCVSLNFDPWNDDVTVEFCGYDVGNWSRHEHRNCKRSEFLKKFEEWVKEAEDIVSKQPREEAWNYD